MNLNRITGLFGARWEGVKMYIKVEDLFNATINNAAIWNHITDSKGRTLKQIVADLPKYEVKQTKKKGSVKDAVK